MKCTRGANCVHPDGPELDESEFYGRDRRCQKCAIAYGKQSYDAQNAKEVADKIDLLSGLDVRRRRGLVYGMIEEGKITRNEFRVICRNVKL